MLNSRPYGFANRIIAFVFAFILDDGASVELPQFDTARAVRPKTRLPNNALHLTTARAKEMCRRR
jgi:hypothetical protein